jgi:hypothetical protein
MLWDGQSMKLTGQPSDGAASCDTELDQAGRGGELEPECVLEIKLLEMIKPIIEELIHTSDNQTNN